MELTLTRTAFKDFVEFRMTFFWVNLQLDSLEGHQQEAIKYKFAGDKIESFSWTPPKEEYCTLVLNLDCGSKPKLKVNISFVL